MQQDDMVRHQARGNLPEQPTPFVGRREILDDLHRRLINPDCRLLTLVGSGGAGKTRMAIELARQHIDDFSDGVYFVALHSVNTTESLLTKLADTLNLPLSGQTEPDIQLINYLSNKNLLLILDNFEHLLSKASFLSELLRATAQLKVIVTSREVLHLREEWLYSINGMYIPEQSADETSSECDAVELFTHHAQRVQRHFALESEYSHVIRICQMVDGLPLGIVLAASWLRHLSCAEIADEIAGSLDFLKANFRNFPERHRSMRAVFEQSLQLLSDKQRAVFQSLSIFHGPFGREAAAQIAGAGVDLLFTLVDKSLVERQVNGCYRIHELLRQYAEDQLRNDAERYLQLLARFRNYYASFLEQRMDAMVGGGQLDALAEIGAEFDNIRIAWQQAVSQKDAGFFGQATICWSLFHQFKSRYTEGAEAMKAALTCLPDEPNDTALQVKLNLQVEVGWFMIRLGQLQVASRVLQQCRDLYRELGQPPVYGHATDPNAALGIIAMIKGEYKKAWQHGETARQIAETHQQSWNLTFAYYVLTNASLAQGELQDAKQFARAAYELAEGRQDRWFMAYCLNERGNVARALQNYDAARQYYVASYELRKEFDDPQGVAIALNYLGEIALLQDAPVIAHRYLEQSRMIYEDIADSGGLAEALTGLGAVAAASGHAEEAYKHFRRALTIAREINYLPLILTIFNKLAAMWLNANKTEQGNALLQFIVQHPSVSQETRSQAQARLQHKSEVPVTSDLHTLIRNVMEDLANDAPVSSVPVTERDVLVEPLTDRELDVLRLLAKGFTNKEIAETLTIVVGTVKAHNHNIYSKLDVSNRTQAVSRARELHLLTELIPSPN